MFRDTYNFSQTIREEQSGDISRATRESKDGPLGRFTERNSFPLAQSPAPKSMSGFGASDPLFFPWHVAAGAHASYLYSEAFPSLPTLMKIVIGDLFLAF